MTQTIKSTRPRLRVCLIALAALAAVLVPATSAPQKANAASAAVVKYWETPPKYDPVLLGRIAVYQMDMADDFGFCQTTGMAVFDNMKYDHRRWFKKSYAKSRYAKSVRVESAYRGPFDHCRWIGSWQWREALSGGTTIWYNATKLDWLASVRDGLAQARCQLAWSGLTTAYGAVAPWLASQYHASTAMQEIVGQTATTTLDYITWCT